MVGWRGCVRVVIGWWFELRCLRLSEVTFLLAFFLPVGLFFYVLFFGGNVLISVFCREWPLVMCVTSLWLVLDMGYQGAVKIVKGDG